MSERNPKRFENGSNAQQRSAEEQRRLMEEYDQARYEEAFPVDENAEKAYEEAMAARESDAAARENDENVLIEKRILERPETNQMYLIAQQIAEGRASGGEPMIIGYQEDRLQELLEKYTEKARTDRDLALRNAEINERSTVKGRQIRLEQEMAAEEEYEKCLQEADFIINSTDEAWVNEKTGKASKETESVDTAEKEKNLVEDPEEARLLAEVEEISRAIKDNPEAAEKAGLYDKVKELMAEIDAILASVKKSEEEIKTPKDADEEEIKTPKDGDLDEEKIKTPKDGDLDEEEEIKTPKDADEEIKTPKDADALIDDETEEEETPRRRGILGVWDRLGLAYAERGGTPAGLIAHGVERLRSSKKGKVVAVIGSLAVVGTLLVGRHYGWFDGGHGGNGNGSGPDQQDYTSGQKGGHPGGDGHIETPPVETGPQIPSGENYAHPWNWMNAAIENGSVTPPKGMGTEQALHYYGDQAAAAGHKVEWYNLPNGLEAIRVDGSDDTAKVADVLTQFAK